MTIVKGALLTTGKAKAVYATDDPNVLWLHSLNQATALNGKQKAEISDKGRLTTQISQQLFRFLKSQGIVTHFQQAVGERDVLVTALDMLPIEVVIRNYAAGHFATRYSVPMLTPLSPTVQEYYFKNDALDDPPLNQSQIFALDLATPSQLTQIEAVSQTVNRQLGQLFEAVGITLIDFKLEFGLDATGALTLGDELSPDNMRLIDQATGQSLDKDVFRQGTGDLRDGYTTVLHRLTTYLGE